MGARERTRRLRPLGPPLQPRPTPPDPAPPHATQPRPAPPRPQQLYYAKGPAFWYEPVFKVLTLQGDAVWRRRKYRVRRGPEPGTFYYRCDPGRAGAGAAPWLETLLLQSWPRPRQRCTRAARG
jgi:hypothetical protein